MKLRVGIIFSCVFVLLLVSGCSVNTFKVKQVPYVKPSSPKSDETLIYVFRENTFYGSARKFSIICNDTIMGVLTSGTFCAFKVKSGENEIVAYMSPSPLMHYRVQGQSGKAVYLFCKFGYSTGIFMEEIDEQKAGALMHDFKYTEIGVKDQRAKMNYRTYYDNLYK